MNYAIDINCDLGEGIADDAQLMRYISSCSIACGGHAGDETTMRNALQLAKKHQVGAGAHPSYPDKEHFGRKTIPISLDELGASLMGQMQRLSSIAKKLDVQIHHVKPHGALYDQATKDRSIAGIVVKAMKEVLPDARMYAPFRSWLAQEAIENKVEVTLEAFADRNYEDDLSLVRRSNPKAIIDTPEDVLAHLLTMVQYHKVRSINGKLVPIRANTFCVHGDHQNTIEVLRYLSSELSKNNIQIIKH